MYYATLVRKCKTALRITSTIYDEQIEDLVKAAELDLGIAGVLVPTKLDALVDTAVTTYVAVHFGQPEDYDRLKASYDEQKAQLQYASAYRGTGNV